VMVKLHNAVIWLDIDELTDFKKNYPQVIRFINEYAIIEDMRLL